jgi:hypothetical protein
MEVNKNEITNLDVNVEWSNDHEDILIEWADKAMCYKWLHSKSHILFSKLNYAYTIPVIIISTLTGTANFAQDRVPYKYKDMFIMIIGGFNILAGIITTIQQFLKITQLTEAHRVSSIGWDKFYRNIKVEISKTPDERMNVDQMLKICKEEYDRLIETSPVIPENVIQQFKYEFSNKLEYKEIIKPEICGVLISTENYRNQWSNPENIAKKKNIKLQKFIKIKNIITKFSNDFYNINSRYPTHSEYYDNLFDNLSNQIELVEFKNIIEEINKENNNDIDTDIPV